MLHAPGLLRVKHLLVEGCGWVGYPRLFGQHDRPVKVRNNRGDVVRRREAESEAIGGLEILGTLCMRLG
jgi:hypothetical protein